MKKTGNALCLWLLVLLLALAPAGAALGQAAQSAPPSAPPAVKVVQLPRELDFWSLSQSLQVFCIPVGAQDCFLIVCEGHAMVLDCAGLGREPTPDLLLQLLKALNIQRLDFALNTHPHLDHINGFPALLAQVPAEEFLTVFPLDYDAHQKKLMRELDALHIPVRLYTAGEPLTLGSAQVDTYRYRKSQNTNDLSLVVRVRYGERSILFTADIGLTAQRKLALEYGDALKADILKLPHHGTGGLSGQLLDTVQPELCFASNTKTSHSPDTMRAFVLRRAIPLLFTARHPLVMLTDGHVWQVQQWYADSIQLPNYTAGPLADPA